MARRTRDFEVDKAGLAALFISSDMRAAMTAAGQDVAGAASLTAPYRTGRLAGSFRVEPTIATVVTKRGGSRGGRRAAWSPTRRTRPPSSSGTSPARFAPTPVSGT